MSRQKFLDDLKAKLGGDILAVAEKRADRVYVDLKPEAIGRAASYLFKEKGCRFNTASGVDVRSHFEILYHFTQEDMDVVVSFRVKLPKDRPEIESLTSLFEAANWIEREMNELLGLQFRGHPDMRRLLLPEDWPEGVYPLRQDYQEWDKTAIRDRGV